MHLFHRRRSKCREAFAGHYVSGTWYYISLLIRLQVQIYRPFNELIDRFHDLLYVDILSETSSVHGGTENVWKRYDDALVTVIDEVCVANSYSIYLNT